MFRCLCNYCDKPMKIGVYCSKICEEKNEIRMKPVDDWDIANPNPNYIQRKEREKILDMCRRLK